MLGAVLAVCHSAEKDNDRGTHYKCTSRNMLPRPSVLHLEEAYECECFGAKVRFFVAQKEYFSLDEKLCDSEPQMVVATREWEWVRSKPKDNAEEVPVHETHLVADPAFIVRT